MLTRLEVTGFKNLHDFALDFGPYTCIAGRNGVGKSNIFDAIHFLSLLTDNTINDAALKVRQVHDVGESTGEIADLLCAGDGTRSKRIELCAEMLVPRSVADGLVGCAFGEPHPAPARRFAAFRAATQAALAELACATES